MSAIPCSVDATWANICKNTCQEYISHTRYGSFVLVCHRLFDNILTHKVQRELLFGQLDFFVVMISDLCLCGWDWYIYVSVTKPVSSFWFQNLSAVFQSLLSLSGAPYSQWDFGHTHCYTLHLKNYAHDSRFAASSCCGPKRPYISHQGEAE